MLNVFLDYVPVELRRNIFFTYEVVKAVESVFEFRTFIRVDRKEPNEFLFFDSVYHDETRLSKSHTCQFEV